MPSFDGLACTDEDIALAATSDYPRITPNAWRLAQGSDGTATGLVFSSATVDFEAVGVAAGMVLVLTGETAALTSDTLAIDAVDGKSLTLHRLGLGTGIGMGPTLRAGKTAFTFEVPSCHATIAEMTRRLVLRYTHADPAPAVTDLKCAAVEMVLCELYGSAHQLAGIGGQVGDNFRAKYLQHLTRRDECLATLDSLYGIGAKGDPTAPGPGRRRPAVGFLPDQTDWPLGNGLWDR